MYFLKLNLGFSKQNISSQTEKSSTFSGVHIYNKLKPTDDIKTQRCYSKAL